MAAKKKIRCPIRMTLSYEKDDRDKVIEIINKIKGKSINDFIREAINEKLNNEVLSE